MYISYKTPVDVLIAKINNRMLNLFSNHIKGAYIEYIQLDSTRKTILLNEIAQEMLGETTHTASVPIEVQCSILLMSGKVVETKLTAIDLSISIHAEKVYELENHRELRNLLEGRFTELRYKLLTTYPKIFTPYGDVLTTTQCQTHLFLTVLESEFENIVNNYQSLNYVKKPTIKNIDNLLHYYVERDKHILSLFHNVIKSVADAMYKKDWYIYRNLPVYRKQIVNRDKLYIAPTFGLLVEPTGEIIILYDYKKKMSEKEVVTVLEDFLIPYGDIELIITLYKYSKLL